MRRVALAATMAALLAGCSTDAPAPAPPTPAPRPAPVPPAPPPPAVAANEQCGLRQAQALVGRPRSEIPVPLDPALQRVACTTCPVTLDFNPRRLNFFFDAESGLIKEVRCG